MSQVYDSTSIDVLEGLEAVRKRPGMYIGNIDKRGLHHLIWEIVDNSIDEHLAGNGNLIEVTLHKDNSISVTDYGRGIPVDIHPKTKITTLETILTVLHAGGKFGGENSGYKVSGGLHGVGASVVNALSVSFEAYVNRDNKRFYIKFENGGKKVIDVKEVGTSTCTGTTIKFKPDFSIFNSDVNFFESGIIIDRLKQTAYLNKNLKIIFKDEINNLQHNFHFENGLIDYIDEINKNNEVIFENVIYNEGQKDNVSVEVAFQYIKSAKSSIFTYANNIYTSEGGTHEQGFIDALLKTINNYVDKNLSSKQKVQFKRDDIKDGLTAIVSIKHSDPMFEGQTKNKLANNEVRKIVNQYVSESYNDFLMENPQTAEIIIAKLKMAADSRIAAQKAREKVRKDSSFEFSTLPGKLADCSSKDIENTELFIVEGDSAGGSAKMGRDREIQAILPLKGKILNAQKAKIGKLMQNDEINALITAIGTKIGEDFNIEKIRYGKIIIMTDADVDGSHIRTLILTFFYRYMRNLIINGKIYIAQPPLYKIIKGKTSFYIYTDEEKEERINLLNQENAKYSIQRYKGLGEMNDDQLWETTMDPDNRKLLRVNIDEALRADKIFDDLMGDFVEPRKEFIIRNARKANLDV